MVHRAQRRNGCAIVLGGGLTDVGVEKGLILSRVVRALGHGERIIVDVANRHLL